MLFIPIIISVFSLLISISSFLVPLYKSTYRLGVANQRSIFDESTREMSVRISFINESANPITIVGLTVTKDKIQTYAKDIGSLKKSHEIKNTEFLHNGIQLPLLIKPYSIYTGDFIFDSHILYQSDYFLEVQTPKRFLEFPFNPRPDIVTNEYKSVMGRTRENNVTWRQSQWRELW
ncbi:hypothetical protein ACXM1Q_001715 [Streptococcus sp. 10F2]